MILPKSIFLLINIAIIIQIQLVSISICQINPLIQYDNYCAKTYGNYTNNSPYKTNLNTLFSNLISSIKPPTYGFYNLSVGHVPNKAIEIALCRGDVSIDDCRTCLQDATITLPKLCPNEREAIIWYDICMLQYSNSLTLEVSEDQSPFILNNPGEIITNPDNFYRVLDNLFTNLSSQAAYYSSDSQHMFATGEANVTNKQKIYALTQCIPNLSQLDCFNCLINYIWKLRSCCANKKGARIVGFSCNIRYDLYQFYIKPPPLSTNPSSSQGNGSDLTTKIVIVIVILAVLLFIALIIIFYIFKRRKSRNKNTKALVALAVNEPEEDDNVCLQFHLNTIKVATQNFSEASRLGKGGFGIVYKGRLENGQEIAVKRLSRNSGQGDQEFKNEVSLVAKLQHRNLVRLLGFCLEKEERLLIYEFVENASLDHFLFDQIKRTYLDWGKRYKIITGIARGILYLHEDSRFRIIHRDLKASNILLDANLNPKISDFGMAKLFDVGQTQGDTSRIAGTYGYMPPEYALQGLFSAKSDVYSFGVLILEIVTGRKSCNFHGDEDSQDLITFVWRNWRQKTTLDIIDPSLPAEAGSEIIRCIHIGLLCIQNIAEDRPTMSAVVLMLSSQSLTLTMPPAPTFLTQTHTTTRILTDVPKETRV